MIRILVIDDEEMVRLNLEAFLEDEGYLVKVAESAEEALFQIPAFAPDILIVDMRLTGMNGNELVMVALDQDPGIGVIIHTGSLEYRLPPSLRELGIEEEQVLYKPLPDMSAINDLIDGLINTHPV